MHRNKRDEKYPKFYVKLWEKLEEEKGMVLVDCHIYHICQGT